MSTPDEQLTPRDEPLPGAVPPQPANEQLQPGAGRPLVEGPPMSVDEPIPAGTINRVAAIGGIGLLAIGAVVVLILALVVIGTCVAHR